MRKNSFKASLGGSSIPVPGVLRPSNSYMTPSTSKMRSNIPKYKNVESAQEAKNPMKRKRSSADKINRVSIASGKITPNKLQTPVQNPCLSVISKTSRISSSTLRSSYSGKAGSIGWPLNDPSFKSRCIDKVLEFLINNKCEYPLNRGMLRNPTKKDFSMIFNFIYKYIRPRHVISSRFEDEIPQILKMLKYPIQMPKSSFLNVGSPHTWPSVLAMLTWLIDLVTFMSASKGVDLAFPRDFPDEINPTEKKFSSFVSTYYCKDDQECRKIVAEYKLLQEEEKNLKSEQLEVILEEEENLRTKLSNLRGPEEEICEIRKQCLELSEDKQKLIKFHDDLKLHLASKDAERGKLAEELGERQMQHKYLEEEIERLEALRLNQQYSVSELKKFKNHASQSSSMMTHLQNDKKSLNEQVWKLEMTISKGFKTLNELKNSFNDMCSNLQIEECELSNANLENEVDTRKGQILDIVTAKKKALKDQHFEVYSSLVYSRKEKEQLKSMLKEKEHTLHKSEQQCKRLEEEIECLKAENSQEEKELQKECERLGDAVSQARRHPKVNLSERQKELETAKEALEALRVREQTLRVQGRQFCEEKVKFIEDSLQEFETEVQERNQRIKEALVSNLMECKDILSSLEKD